MDNYSLSAPDIIFFWSKTALALLYLWVWEILIIEDGIENENKPKNSFQFYDHVDKLEGF